MARLVLLGYGSLLSKKGIRREGSAPRIHRAWAARVPGLRGFSKTFGGGRKVVMDAFLDEARVLTLRRLEHYVDGAGHTADAPAPRYSVERTFEAIALEVDAEDWAWYDAREEFPAGLGAALAEDARATGRGIDALLGAIMAEAGIEAYARALFDRYRPRLGRDDYDAFARSYLPFPLKLPDADDLDASTGNDWGIICATAIKELPHQRMSVAAARPGVDPVELVSYYVDCVLGGAHGIDVTDIRDDAFESAHPDVARLVAAYAKDEDRPLAIAPPREHQEHAHASAGERAGHGMRPLKDLMRLDDALTRLEGAPLRPLDDEEVALEDADGRVLAADVQAPFDVPAFDKCAMDGYAVRAEDTFGAGEHAPRRVRRVAVLHAGAAVPSSVTTGTCIQVATGAPLPRGADAVVMVERTRANGDEIDVFSPAARGEHIVPRGSDIASGALVLGAGTRLDPSRLAALASVGSERVYVRRRPRVAVMPTGDEVIPLGRPLGPGQVYESNGHALAALARRAGADVTRLRSAPDDAARLGQALDAAIAEHDVVVVTGGTSAGARDLLPGLLAERGEVLFHGIRVRPGKPVVAAVVEGTLVLGLPGYPTSCVVTAEVLLVPLLSRMLGLRGTGVRWVTARLGARLSTKGGFRQFVPVRLDPDRTAHVVFRGSSAVSSLSDADGLIDIAEDVEVVPEGTEVQVRLLT